MKIILQGLNNSAVWSDRGSCPSTPVPVCGNATLKDRDVLTTLASRPEV